MSTLKPIRTTAGNQAAVVFIHGFGGNYLETWQNFPRYLVDDSRLSGWNIYSLGYDTHLRVDVGKLWTADPDLQEVAVKLSTDVQVGAIRGYKSLALVAHSMGGLVTQRALLDSADLRDKISHVFLFGTPSGGLKSAYITRWLKPQLRDMARDGVFIRKLREDWDTRFSRVRGQLLPFVFSAVGGSLDEFVPYESSLGPFPEEAYPSCRFVVPGDHLKIVKPTSPESESVQLVVNRLIGHAPSTEVWNSARVAIESRDFQRAVDLLEARVSELDKEGIVQLALGLEGVGRRDDAISLLQQRGTSDTDPMGVLAGRLKRRWLLNRIEKDGEMARQLYGKALERALAQQDYSQAYYHGINVAFFQLFADRQLATAQATARDVLAYCQKAQAGELASDRKWRLATEGEALIHLNQPDAAYARYQQAIAPEQGAEPREIESMYQQAIYLSREVGDNLLRRKLTKLFRNEDSE
ncbi:MAG: hypothetical protein A4S08_09905 [Proteobacteria bacterium SG_bin4]|nr:MAG: hypothetical protein A4S08_09905 [Proteobacteria bacterium SG_bin4]